jgi:hypothetical protein
VTIASRGPSRVLDTVRIVFLYRLRPGVTRDAYERWSCDVDIPFVTRLSSVSACVSLRLGNPTLESAGAMRFDYCDIVTIEDRDVYATEVATHEAQEIGRQWLDFVDEYVVVPGEALAEFDDHGRSR